jgi:tetratricopeptide (TPR) repeat protein
MRGQFDVARGLVAEGMTLADELGLQLASAGLQFAVAEVELLAGRPDVAELALRPVIDALQRMGNQGHFATMAPVFADILFAQGRGEEAAPLIELAARWTLADDLDAQIGWRRSQAKLLGQHGDFEHAEVLAREAVDLAGRTDFLDAHAHALEDLATVLRQAGRDPESLAELERAARLYDRKGNLVSAARTRTLLDSRGHREVD